MSEVFFERQVERSESNNSHKKAVCFTSLRPLALCEDRIYRTKVLANIFPV